MIAVVETRYSGQTPTNFDFNVVANCRICIVVSQRNIENRCGCFSRIFEVITTAGPGAANSGYCCEWGFHHLRRYFIENRELEFGQNTCWEFGPSSSERHEAGRYFCRECSVYTNLPTPDFTLALPNWTVNDTNQWSVSKLVCDKLPRCAKRLCLM